MNNNNSDDVSLVQINAISVDCFRLYLKCIFPNMTKSYIEVVEHKYNKT